MASKILVVDDESDLLELITFHLQSNGHEFVVAQDGANALRLAEEHVPDLILLDLMLPEMDGRAVCEMLRQIPATAKIPVLMVTACTTDLARNICLDAGADGYVTKPFSPADLMRKVRVTLQAQTEVDARW